MVVINWEVDKQENSPRANLSGFSSAKHIDSVDADVPLRSPIDPMFPNAYYDNKSGPACTISKPGNGGPTGNWNTLIWQAPTSSTPRLN